MTHLEMTIGRKRFMVEVAYTTEEVRQGLSGRTTLKRNQGMLFILPAPAHLTVEMRKVGVDLDCGYFDSQGKLIEIQPLTANSRQVYRSTSEQANFALEMERNWFKTNNINEGDMLNFMVKTPISMVMEMMKLTPQETINERTS